MSWIHPIEINMNISRTVVEGRWDNTFLEIAQKVAWYAVVPFAIIAMFEAVVKAVCINTLNVGIVILNAGHDLFQSIWGEE